MSEVKNYSITKTIDFYINEASPETIAGRRIYLETVLAPRLRKGLAVLNNINQPEQEDIELRDVYQRGVDFFDKLFDAPVPQVNTTTSN